MRTTGTVCGIVGVLVMLAGLLAAPAGAGPADQFYLPPNPLPVGAPGDIIRSEPFTLALSVPGQAGSIPADATRIMYRSNDTHGLPAAVTGTYLEPTAPWTGAGPRPLVAFAVGTQGQGDQCAPSKAFGQLVHYRFPIDGWAEYEIPAVYALLARGMAVVVTDYHGLGTPPVHDYLNRLAEAHAVLDSLRAAQKLTGRTAPSAIFGYSQGGGAAAAAAELQASYAPELDVRGTYAGAVPADLRVVIDSPAVSGVAPGVVGGAAAGLIGFFLNGIAADYPEARPAIDDALSPLGQTMLAETATACISPETVLRYMFRPTNWFIRDGRSFGQTIDQSPILSEIIARQKIGTLEPTAPVLLAAGTNDDVIPYSQVRQLAADWCARGATVQLDRTAWLPPVLPGLTVGHVLEFVPATAAALDWIAARFAGAPAPSNCADLP